MAEEYEYDVALSFAGDDRNYVQQVADALRAAGVSVFYDKYEAAKLWGKDLYEHLDEVYRKKARFCVMFLSEAYARKAWPGHERESAQARAFEEHEEYILPARFDDTEIPGIRPTLGYVDLRELMPEQLAELVLEKLGMAAESASASEAAPATGRTENRRPKRRSKAFNPYDEALKFIESLVGELKSKADEFDCDGVSASLFEREGRKCLRVVVDGETKYSLDVWLGAMSSDESIGFHGQRGAPHGFGGNSVNAWGHIVWDRDAESICLELHDLSLLGHLGEDRRYTYADFLEKMWDAICEAIEDDY